MVPVFLDLEVKHIGKRRHHRQQERHHQRLRKRRTQEYANQVKSHIHHRPAKDDAERKVRSVILVFAAASRQIESQRRTASKASQQASKPDSLARAHQLNENVAHKTDARYEHHEQPDGVRIQHFKAMRAVSLIRQERQNQRRYHRELDCRQDVFLGKLLRKGMQLFLRRKHPEHHHHDYARFQQATVPANASKQIDNHKGHACRNAISSHRSAFRDRLLSASTNRKRHMACHQKHSNHNDSCNERSDTAHLVRKQGRHGSRKRHQRKRANPRRMS